MALKAIRDCHIPVNQMRLLLLLFSLISSIEALRRNFDLARQNGGNSNIPLWKQRACEKTQKYKANSHYTCDEKGDVKCLPGWQGDLCQVPMCRRGCDPMNGYCQRPGECRCRIGYTGDMCDKCIPLPGCQHGDCTKPFECICKPGWDGLFCTEPSCRSGCHSTRGYCEAPGECRCRIGWAGRTCSDCSTMPGCQHGTCNKPLECNCLPGYTGLLCQTPLCASDCSKQHGYCRKPGECRCKVGWTGSQCDKCFPYPGCVHGDCEAPWECNCHPGWGGMLCDEKLNYCMEHPDTCENESKCISLSREDGSYRCLCRQGYLGQNCEIRDEFLLTSVAPPRITPPSTDVEPDPGVLDDSTSNRMEEEILETEEVENSAVLPATSNEPKRPTNDTAAAAAATATATTTPTTTPTKTTLTSTTTTGTTMTMTTKTKTTTTRTTTIASRTRTSGVPARGTAGETASAPTSVASATIVANYNGTNEALSNVPIPLDEATTMRHVPRPPTSELLNATSVTTKSPTISHPISTASTGTPTATPIAQFTVLHEQLKSTVAPAVTTSNVNDNDDDGNGDDDDDDDDGDEDDDGEYEEEEEDEDEDDEEDDSDQIIPNII